MLKKVIDRSDNYHMKVKVHDVPFITLLVPGTGCYVVMFFLLQLDSTIANWNTVDKPGRYTSVNADDI